MGLTYIAAVIVAVCVGAAVGTVFLVCKLTYRWLPTVAFSVAVSLNVGLLLARHELEHVPIIVVLAHAALISPISLIGVTLGILPTLFLPRFWPQLAFQSSLSSDYRSGSGAVSGGPSVSLNESKAERIRS